MNQQYIGFEKYQQTLGNTLGVSSNNIARVAAEDKNSVTLFSSFGEIQGVLRGTFRKNTNVTELPKVGDFVEIEKLPGENKATITKVLPRITTLGRFWAATHREQIIATNIDTLFITESYTAQVNVDRIERMVLAAKQTGCIPVIILNKLDLAEASSKKILQQLSTRLEGIKIISVSARERMGMAQIETLIQNNLGAAFIGSSGVGKSSLINTLTHTNTQKIGEVRTSDSKGKHTTTRREMIVLPSGGIIIDTPGLREFENKFTEQPVQLFLDIEEIARDCKFNDCNHTSNPDCAVRQAVKSGVLTEERYNSFVASRLPKIQKRTRLSRKPGTLPKRRKNI